MSIAKELLIKKAKEGYTVCYVDECPLRTQCLRWQVGRMCPTPIAPTDVSIRTSRVWRLLNVRCIATTRRCASPKGMLHTFTSDMPKRLEPAVRQGVISLTNRTYYFEYRNGSRLIPPALQEDIRKLFRANGWTTEVTSTVT